MAIVNYYTINGQIRGQRAGSGSRVRYLPDALGSVTKAVQTSTITSASYTPYGRGNPPTNTSVGWVGSRGYRTTGLSEADPYVRSRHLSARRGRWGTVDLLW